MNALIDDFLSNAPLLQAHIIPRSDQPEHSATEVNFLKPVYSQETAPRSPRPQPITTPVSASTPPSAGRMTSQETSDRNKKESLSIETAPPSPPSSSSSARARQQYTNKEKYIRRAPLSGGLPQHPLEDARLKHTSSPSLNLACTSTIIRSPASLDNVQGYGKTIIKVRNLAHIKSFALKELYSYENKSERRLREDYIFEISGMPISDIIEMVAGLLTKIITTNDGQHTEVNDPSSAHEESEDRDENSPSVFAFHGKNVPSISILSYLSRIHKYCPTTYEVFLSLLVYFDRMTERVNAENMENANTEDTDIGLSEPLQNVLEGSDLSDKNISLTNETRIKSDIERHRPKNPEVNLQSGDEIPLSRFFVVDSFNIHRLIIAGVTCASKFFSDVFYTNSRYAKVGGLPLGELNHLELQFLLLNDFRLSVSVEELDIYGTMLVNFYANEMLAQNQQSLPTEKA